MATTTNYGWTTPDDTSLVKDGAAAIRTLGSSIDTTTKNLNPSTTLGDIEYRSSTANTNTRLAIGSTGQVLTVAGGVPSWATPASNPLTTKGDLFTFSTVAARLGVGANGTVLTADSAEATGLKWATASAGAVLAVKQAFKSSTFTTTSTSLTDITGLSVTYTPTSASNKILLIAHIFGMGTIGSSGIGFAFSRGGTAIGIGDASGSLSRVTGATQAADSNNAVISAMMYLDSPATTSSTTWSVQCRVDAATAYVNRTATDGYWRGTSSLTIMEVTP